MSDTPDVIWIEAAEYALHDSGGVHILASEQHVDWLATHIGHMATLTATERSTYPDQFDGKGIHGDAMAAAMRHWIKSHEAAAEFSPE